MPTSLFVDGEIIYQWITYEDDTQSELYTGAVGCKVTVGDFSKT